MSDIDAWHRARGFSSCGYHSVILDGRRHPGGQYEKALDGKIEPGRDATLMGAHCQARGMNAVTLGVCCVGLPDWPQKRELAPKDATRRAYLTARQYAALIRQLAVWCRHYQLNPLGRFLHRGRLVSVITQHSEHDKGKPLCASLNITRVRQDVQSYMKNAGWM